MTIVEQIKRNRVLLADGAWGTMMIEQGLELGKCAELWTIERPTVLEAIARAYLDAGASLVETNTFGGSSVALSKYNLEARAFELNTKAVSLVRAIVDAHAQKTGRGAKVMASMGSCGKMLCMDEVSEEALYLSFCEQARAFSEGGADAVCIETMVDGQEAAIAIQAVKDTTDLDVIVSFTFDKTVQGDFKTMMGLSCEDAARLAFEKGADVTGTNCSHGIAAMVDVVRRMHGAVPEMPLIVQANAGLPELREGVFAYAETPEFMASHIPQLIAAGASIIGGCCGTTPQHIAAFRGVIDAYLAQ